MAELFSDDFNRANEELDASADWTERGGTIDLDIVSNQVDTTTNPNAEATAYISSSYITTADYRVTCDINRNTSTNSEGLCIRRVNYGSDRSSCYNILINATVMSIWEWLGGSGWSQIGSNQTITMNTNTFYTCYIEVDGSDITVDFDSGAVNYGPQTDTTLTASGDCGFQLGESGAGSFSWDNFVVDDLVAGGATGKSNPLFGPLGGPLAGALGI